MILDRRQNGRMLLPRHPLLWTPENTRKIRFAYHGKDRIAEPHDHGILKGSVFLLLFLREIAEGPSAAADSPLWTAPRSSAESSQCSLSLLVVSARSEA
jgi:hypothetical protein